jgi:hypothetical protein
MSERSDTIPFAVRATHSTVLSVDSDLPEHRLGGPLN